MNQTTKKLIKKRDSFYLPKGEFKKRAWVSQKSIYKKALQNPLRFWEEQAKTLKWFKEWTGVFSHKPPYFEWFSGGKINISQNCLDEQLKERKNKIALIWEPEPISEPPRVLSYYELFREVNRCCNALKKLGVKKGDRVGIYLPMIPEAVIAMLACCRVGAVHSVVFSAFSSQALKVRLQDTGAKVLITADGYYRRGKVVDLKKSADLALRGTKIKKVIVIKRAGNKVTMRKGRDLWWHELAVTRPLSADSGRVTVAPVPMDSEDLLFILYTSGSTGQPKGTMHTCGGYTVQAKTTGKWIFDWHEDDIFWSTADLGWITGHTYSCYSPLLNGVTFLLYEGSPDWPAPDRWAQIIEKYGVTIFYTAPTAIRMFEKYGTDLVRKHKLGTLRLLGSVGEPIDEAAWKWYFKEVGKERCPIVDTWWQTETGGILIVSLPGVGPFKPSFAGLPFPGVSFDILDDKGKTVKANKEGNLVMLKPFSPGLLRGIYRNPEKYLETYWSQYGKKVYFTSDSAYRDKRGLIRIVGRVDDVIKVAGHRFTTGELESAISLHPDITESAVVSRPDEIKGEVPVAFVVSKNQKKSPAILQKEVIDYVRREIGPIALLKEVYIVDDLPKTRSGKIMRRILKQLIAGKPLAPLEAGRRKATVEPPKEALPLTGLGDLSTLANPQSVEIIKKQLTEK